MVGQASSSSGGKASCVRPDSSYWKIKMPETTSLINEHVSKAILRWNFPTFGTLYLDVLTNFVIASTKGIVDKVCRKDLRDYIPLLTVG